MDENQPKQESAGHHYDAIQKSEGVTSSEKYLGKLCERNFLSLWSYPGVFRDQGQPGSGGDGKEICDLLVVFDQHIIIFSDKHCTFKPQADQKIAWKRWFKNAVEKSADQAWGAKRWIESFPNRIFVDRECTQRLPIDLPPQGSAVFHLVVVAHGISSHIKQAYPGSSGSLIIDTAIKDFQNHNRPFTIGDLSPAKAFVHVFDDDSLNSVMSTRDTISDFVSYLSKRQRLFRDKATIIAPGEEEILAVYLETFNSENEHDFVFVNKAGEPYARIGLEEGLWDDFINSPKRRAQIEADKISYSWDALLDKFNFFAMRGEQYFVSGGGLKDTERALRLMAREPRWKRRYLAQDLNGMVNSTSTTDRRLQVHPPCRPNDPYYVLLLFPALHFKSNEEYRTTRREFLKNCCLVTKLQFPDAKDIVGIASESGPNNDGRSEDVMYMDVRVWDSKIEPELMLMKEKLGILMNARQISVHQSEFPDVISKIPKLKNYRNKPCPCGSGKKYKKCCLNTPR
jgi:hypothetical protein